MHSLRKTIINTVFLILIQTNLSNTQSLLIDQTTVKSFNSWNQERM